MKIYSGYATNTGDGMQTSADVCATDEANGCFVVADGLGNSSQGLAAARTVCSVMVNALRQGDSMEKAVGAAHLALYVDSAKTRTAGHAGASAAALRLRDDIYEIVWVGHSRIYRFDDHMMLMTRDHSVVEELLASGSITAEAIMSHPDRGKLTQALGKTHPDSLEPDFMSGKTYPGNRWLLCTDGLVKHLTAEQIATVLGQNNTPSETAQALIRLVPDGSVEDNLTALVVDIQADPNQNSRRSPA